MKQYINHREISRFQEKQPLWNMGFNLHSHQRFTLPTHVRTWTRHASVWDPSALRSYPTWASTMQKGDNSAIGPWCEQDLQMSNGNKTPTGWFIGILVLACYNLNPYIVFCQYPMKGKDPSTNTTGRQPRRRGRNITTHLLKINRKSNTVPPGKDRWRNATPICLGLWWPLTIQHPFRGCAIYFHDGVCGATHLMIQKYVGKHINSILSLSVN